MHISIYPDPTLFPKTFERRAICYLAPEVGTDDTKTALSCGMYLQELICEI